MKPTVHRPTSAGAVDPSAAREEGDALAARIRRLERAARPLEPGSAGRKRLRRAALASSERFLRRIATLPAFAPGTGAELLAHPIVERGIDVEDALALLEAHVVRPGGNPASGGHLAYIPGGGLYHSALGDFLAAVSNKYAGLFFTGPGAVRLENMLLRWAAELVGYPAAAGGNIASGGSLATLTAIVAAREAHELRGAGYASAVVYLTAQAHHSIAKALRIAGLGEARVHLVPMDDGARMRADALAQAIEEDRARGLRPWLVVATAGSTDTGAVDPLDAIADVAERARCWYHVDAAYGGFFLLTAHGRAALAGIERSDSVVLDPHKGLFLPYGSGIVLARDARRLAATFTHTGAYMQDALEDPSELSPADVSPELTRHFRGLRMWLPLVTLGVAPFRAALEEKLLLARWFRRAIAAAGFRAGPEPDLSIVTFRWSPAGVARERANAVNRELVERVRRDGRVFLSSTRIDGWFTIRMVALHFRTHLRTLELAVRILREQLDAILAGGSSSTAERVPARRHE